MKTNKLSCGLFMFRGVRWWRNLKDIPIFIRRIFFVLRHGYSPVAQWETFEWFRDVMKEILINYRHNRVGSPMIIDNFWDGSKNIDAYDNILDKMIELLDQMDENNKIYDNVDWKTKDKLMNDAKNEFFKLFSKYYYDLWD